MRSKHNEIEALRSQADYNTGSISFASTITSALLSFYFRPQIVAEVGTFIGRSTYSLALGADFGGVHGLEIYTCDISNEIEIIKDERLANIRQYPKSTSTEMFKALILDGIKPDLYYLDGRLTDEDIVLMDALGASNAIIVLDDFEGTEKGIVNAMKIESHFQRMFLTIYPPEIEILRENSLTDGSSVAVLMPKDGFICEPGLTNDVSYYNWPTVSVLHKLNLVISLPR